MRLPCNASLVALTIVAVSAPAWAADDEKRPETALEIGRELGLSDDDRRPEDQLRVKVLGRPLIVGGAVEAQAEFRGNYDLGTDGGNDDLSIAPEIKVETIWLLDDDLVTFTDASASLDSEVYKQGGGGETEKEIKLSEAWILKTRLFGTPLALQVGRQQLQDRREWWWDENLDMVRLHYFGRDVRAFAGIGRDLGHYSTLGRRDPEDKDIVRIAASAQWDWADRQELHFYFLNHRDKSPREAIGTTIGEDDIDEVDGNYTWFGLRARGRVKTKFPGKFYYWVDVALLRGHQDELDLDELPDGRSILTGRGRSRARGWAFDAGASLELPFAFKPYLTLAYARGSGGTDTFRQTGLHGNNGKFRGNSRFRYYGEVLRPELSNLNIATAALGIPLGEDGWVETVWHRYRQVTADDRISGSRLDIDPLGVSRAIGQEFDLVASYRPKSGWDFELTGGAFRAGRAFGPAQGQWAWSVGLKIGKNF